MIKIAPVSKLFSNSSITFEKVLKLEKSPNKFKWKNAFSVKGAWSPPEPGISGLEKAAPPGELEFCSRSN